MDWGQPAWAVTAAMFGGFAALWLLMFQVVAAWGGWRALAEAYPAPSEATGERFRMRSLQLRAGCNYNNCVTLVATPAGLQLSMPLPFRFAHAPIFLPWSDLRTEESKTWFISVVTLTASRRPEIPIKLRPKLARRLLSAGGAGIAPLGIDAAGTGEA